MINRRLGRACFAPAAVATRTVKLQSRATIDAIRDGIRVTVRVYQAVIVQDIDNRQLALTVAAVVMMRPRSNWMVRCARAAASSS